MQKIPSRNSLSHATFNSSARYEKKEMPRSAHSVHPQNERSVYEAHQAHLLISKTSQILGNLNFFISSSLMIGKNISEI